MTWEWLKNLLPILNATGVPLLGLAVVLLIAAYRHAAEAYERTANGLRAENDRLRERLTAADTTYATELDRIKTIARASVAAIEELQARKVALLSQESKLLISMREDPIDMDVERINQAIRALRELSAVSKESDLRIRETLVRVERHFSEVEASVGELADRIGDTKGRLALVGVLASGPALDEVRRAVSDVPRGRTTRERDVDESLERLLGHRDDAPGQLPAGQSEERD